MGARRIATAIEIAWTMGLAASYRTNSSEEGNPFASPELQQAWAQGYRAGLSGKECNPPYKEEAQ